MYHLGGRFSGIVCLNQRTSPEEFEADAKAAFV